MADKLRDDTEMSLVRLSCDCLDPTHSLDLITERVSPVGKAEGCATYVEWAEHYQFLPLWERLKRAIQILLGRELWGHGFMLRREDIPAVISALSQAIPQESKTAWIPQSSDNRAPAEWAIRWHDY